MRAGAARALTKAIEAAEEFQQLEQSTRGSEKKLAVRVLNEALGEVSIRFWDAYLVTKQAKTGKGVLSKVLNGPVIDLAWDRLCATPGFDPDAIEIDALTVLLWAGLHPLPKLATDDDGDDAMKAHEWPEVNGAHLGALDVPGQVERDFTLVLAQPTGDPSAEWMVVGSTNMGMMSCMIADDYQRGQFKAGRAMTTRIVMGAVGPDIFDGVTTPFDAKRDHEEMGEVWP